MSHYHIDIPVDSRDIEVIKREFSSYVNRADGLTITITPDNDIVEPEELGDVLKKLFINLLVRIETGDFRRTH